MNQNTQPNQPTTPSSNADQSKVTRGLLLTAVVILLAAGAWYFLQSNVERTEDAYVDGNIVQVTSQISGTVTSITADNTDHVKAGATLITLNPVDQEVRFERARTELAKATRMARTQYSQVQQLQAEVAQRQNDVQKARTDLARRSGLAASGAVSREEISHTEDVFKNAQDALNAVKQSLQQRLAMVDGTSLRTHPGCARRCDQSARCVYRTRTYHHSITG